MIGVDRPKNKTAEHAEHAEPDTRRGPGPQEGAEGAQSRELLRLLRFFSAESPFVMTSMYSVCSVVACACVVGFRVVGVFSGSAPACAHSHDLIHHGDNEITAPLTPQSRMIAAKKRKERTETTSPARHSSLVIRHSVLCASVPPW